MKSVDVLRDNTVQLACLLHLGKFIVSTVRFYSVGIELLPVEFIEDFRTVDKAVDAEEIFRAVPVELDVVLISVDTPAPPKKTMCLLSLTISFSFP